ISPRIICQEDETFESNPSNVVNNSSIINVTNGEHLPNHLHHQSNCDLGNSHGTPYLLELGLSNSLISLIWLAGPLAGLLVQPIVAHFQTIHSKYDCRKSYIIIGSVAVVIAFLSIDWTKKYCRLSFQLTLLLFGWPFSPFILDFAIMTATFTARERYGMGVKMVGIGSVMAQHQLPFNDPINPKLKEEAERTVTFSVLMSLKFVWKQFLRLPLALTLPKLWSLSHFIFAYSMLASWIVSNIFQAYLVILCVGGSKDNSAINPSTTAFSNASRLYLIGPVHRSDDDDGVEYEELENMCEFSVVDD
ncbi:7309_t:CDS:2, partial [Gigaspora margarita]